jgi:CPA1 family monovalent cation:H+ antiporter
MSDLVAKSLALLIVAILVAIAARRIALPYTVGLVVAGIALALSRIDLEVTLTRDLIFDLILPPLLFEATLNIRCRDLRRDAIPVFVLSTAGVVISAGVVLVGMTELLGWPSQAALVFGVLIAATDPVAVIAMFKDAGIKGRLRLLVESESLFNDGVAAVLFGLALEWSASGNFDPIQGAERLVAVGGGGVAVGLASGFFALLVAGRTRDRLVECTITLIAAYGSFWTAEHFGFSGVLATVSAGLLLGTAGLGTEDPRLGLSLGGYDLVLELWEFFAFIANSTVFLLIGLTTARIPFSNLGGRTLGIAILLVMIGRAATVYLLSALFSKTRWAIPMLQQHVLWWGGLRGALALALALALPPTLAHRNEVVVAAFAVVTFSVLLQGLTMPALLRWLGLGPS